jgi:hypothetical protein
MHRTRRSAANFVPVHESDSSFMHTFPLALRGGAICVALSASVHGIVGAQALQHATTPPSVVPVSSPATFMVVPPVLTIPPQGQSAAQLTAAEMAEQTGLRRISVTGKVSLKLAHYPVDSLKNEVATEGQRWLGQLRKQSPVRGLQLDPSGRLGVSAEQDAYARAQLAARLATPGLSLADKAYTLLTAVKAFSDVWSPARLPVAEEYLTALDALGDSAAAAQFDARQDLMGTYYLTGRSANVVRHGLRAIALLAKIPFHERRNEMMYGAVYTMTVDGLSGRSDFHQQMEQVNRLFNAATTAPPGLIAFDSGFANTERSYRYGVKRLIAGNAMIGKSGAPLVAHAWVNRGSSDSATVPVNDGKIRVIEMAHTGCQPCVEGVYGLQHLHERFPAIEPVMLTWTAGHWGGRLVEPKEEIAHLTDYFVTSTRVTYPVGIWAGVKVPQEDGGLVPEESLNSKNYPLFGKPMVWIIDGHGVIRKVFSGYSREIYNEIARTVEFLLNEAKA